MMNNNVHKSTVDRIKVGATFIKNGRYARPHFDVSRHFDRQKKRKSTKTILKNKKASIGFNLVAADDFYYFKLHVKLL